jgi:anti-sigma B factor antagonist
MELKDSTSGNRAVITVTGRIDAVASPVLEEAVHRSIDRGSSDLIFDFSGVDYISSAGLRVLLSARKQLLPMNGTVTLVGLRPFVREIFDMTGFSKIFPIYGTLEETV